MGKHGAVEHSRSEERLPVTQDLSTRTTGRAPRLAVGERVEVKSVKGIVSARREVRALALSLGFSTMEACALAAVASELARNMLQYAGKGRVTLSAISKGGHHGVHVIAEDSGPGIASIKRALQPGYSTSGGLGLGLPGVNKIMDELVIDSTPHGGTRVSATRWLRAGQACQWSGSNPDSPAQ